MKNRLLNTICLFAFGFLAGAAQAGNLWLTGHDADLHCSGGTQCNHFGIALDFGRQAAPDKTKPILFLTSPGGDLVAAAGQAVARARNTVEGAGNPFPFVVVDPTDAAFATTVLSVANFSAIVIASDTSCGGCDNNLADIVAINARTAEIQAFFNAGGGLVYFAGAENRDTYYLSVPIPAGAVAVSAPFTLTPEGVALGLLTAQDANCCATHNSFNLPPAGGALRVAETDSAGFAETLFARDATITGGGIGGPGTTFGPRDIPTLSEWGMIILALLVAGFGALTVRRRFG
ncbi:MAG: IPTL-CTERM sorting domain-containing protein [Casimicrobiaceae bacterium]